MTEEHSFRIRPGIPSGPVALNGYKLDKCMATSSATVI